MSSSCTPPNDDNNWSSPTANKINVSSLPVFTNPVALTLALNVFVPLISQLLEVFTEFNSFESTSDIVKQVLATGSYFSSYIQPNGLTYFNLSVIVYQIEPSNLTCFLSVSAFKYVYVFVQQSDKSVVVPANSEIGLIPPAPSNTMLSFIPDLTNNDPDNQDISYIKGEDDALLMLKVNQSTTYQKTETDQLISQIEAGDVDLSGYMTLGTASTINTNKTFNNACRFISSIDGMSQLSGSLFVKSGINDSIVLLGAGGINP
ncbi:MAG: hypothetical protein EZS28_044743, partial [Streblomastix strix]